jgi:hypothetical protein
LEAFYLNYNGKQQACLVVLACRLAVTLFTTGNTWQNKYGVNMMRMHPLKTGY